MSWFDTAKSCTRHHLSCKLVIIYRCSFINRNIASNPQITARTHKAKSKGNLLHENTLQACQRTQTNLIRWRKYKKNMEILGSKLSKTLKAPKGISLFQASLVASQHIAPGSPTMPTALLGGGASTAWKDASSWSRIEDHSGMAQKCQQIPH